MSIGPRAHLDPGLSQMQQENRIIGESYPATMLKPHAILEAVVSNSFSVSSLRFIMGYCADRLGAFIIQELVIYLALDMYILL